MNTIKQSISKRFVKKYCSKVESKVEPNPTFIEDCMAGWSLGFCACLIGGGINGAYKGYERKRLDKRYENDDRVVMGSFVEGGFAGGIFWMSAPFLTIGYLASTIKSKME